MNVWVETKISAPMAAERGRGDKRPMGQMSGGKCPVFARGKYRRSWRKDERHWIELRRKRRVVSTSRGLKHDDAGHSIHSTMRSFIHRTPPARQLLGRSKPLFARGLDIASPTIIQLYSPECTLAENININSNEQNKDRNILINTVQLNTRYTFSL